MTDIFREDLSWAAKGILSAIIQNEGLTLSQLGELSKEKPEFRKAFCEVEKYLTIKNGVYYANIFKKSDKIKGQKPLLDLKKYPLEVNLIKVWNKYNLIIHKEKSPVFQRCLPLLTGYIKKYGFDNIVNSIKIFNVELENIYSKIYPKEVFRIPFDEFFCFSKNYIINIARHNKAAYEVYKNIPSIFNLTLSGKESFKRNFQFEAKTDGRLVDLILSEYMLFMQNKGYDSSDIQSYRPQASFVAKRMKTFLTANKSRLPNDADLESALVGLLFEVFKTNTNKIELYFLNTDKFWVEFEKLLYKKNILF